MGVGPNYVLNKGFLAQTPVTAYAAGLVVTYGTVEQSCITLSAASSLLPLGILTDDIDAAKIATGKAFVGVALLGLVRAKVGAAVTKGDRLTNDTSSRVITQTRAAAGAQPLPVVGIAQTAATAANQFIDVLLTPGASF